MAKCFSCGRKCDLIEDLCQGCHHVVCISCVHQYGHRIYGDRGAKEFWYFQNQQGLITAMIPEASIMKEMAILEIRGELPLFFPCEIWKESK